MGLPRLYSSVRMRHIVEAKIRLCTLFLHQSVVSLSSPTATVACGTPEAHNGDGSFTGWLDHFKCVAALNKWKDDNKILWLCRRLTGKAGSGGKGRPSSSSWSWSVKIAMMAWWWGCASALSWTAGTRCMQPNFPLDRRRRVNPGPIWG